MKSSPPKHLSKGDRNWVWVCRAAGPEGAPTSEEHRWAWAAHVWVLEIEEGALAGHDSGHLTEMSKSWEKGREWGM
jgi:hypothetical protein